MLMAFKSSILAINHSYVKTIDTVPHQGTRMCVFMLHRNKCVLWLVHTVRERHRDRDRDREQHGYNRKQ